MTEPRAILLAAGLSRRMGARNKLLLTVDGVPMIRKMVDTYHAATGQPVLVVTGHQADRVSAVLDNAPADIHFNARYAEGRATSVTCGLRAVGPADRILIGLGDQPHLRVRDIAALLMAHDSADPAKISIPMHDGVRGNPIVIPMALRARLLDDPHSPGCKKFTRAHPEHVQFHALTQAGFYTDVDTPAAYAALSGLRTGGVR